MAGGVSLAGGMTGAGSVLGVVRDAPRAVMSRLAVMWSLEFSVVMGDLLLGGKWGGDAGEDEGPHEAADGGVVGELHTGGGAARVADDDPGDPLGRPGSIVGPEVALEQGPADGPHPRQQ